MMMLVVVMLAGVVMIMTVVMKDAAWRRYVGFAALLGIIKMSGIAMFLALMYYYLR